MMGKESVARWPFDLIDYFLIGSNFIIFFFIFLSQKELDTLKNTTGKYDILFIGTQQFRKKLSNAGAYIRD